MNKHIEHDMRVATLLDTATASTNLGDQIIIDAVNSQLKELFSDAFIYSVASHERMGKKSRSLLARSDFTIAGGTNLLSSRMWFNPLWKLTPRDAFIGHDVTLMGVGWYQFQREPDLYTRLLLRRVLSKQQLHSVRDSYTQKKLASIGITNVVNTGCPTLWGLSPERCSNIPVKKADHVITTLNTYITDPELDKQLLKILRKYYDKVYFWIQTETDYAYSKELDSDLVYLEPSLAALDKALMSNTSLDYVGNRLHAGIRALQHGRRAIIVEIDNRAQEMGSDFCLPTIKRDEFSRLSEMIQYPFETRVQLPNETISRWKEQFKLANV